MIFLENFVGPLHTEKIGAKPEKMPIFDIKSAIRWWMGLLSGSEGLKIAQYDQTYIFWVLSITFKSI